MPDHPIIAPKKLIEVALPLDDINRASAREKSIRHGHPSTLHLWWARRPLAACRAVLFAQLVNDPSWKYTDEELKKPGVKGAVTKKRNELFQLIKELVPWDPADKQKSKDVLDRAREEIRLSWKETCAANKGHPAAHTLFIPEKLPAFHDPFAGGGSIPLEAQRLGLEAHASDLNPVAVLINKAMIEIPPKFAGSPAVGPLPKGDKQAKVKATEDWSGARGLAEDVRRYGAWMREEAERRIGHLYPKARISKKIAKDRPELDGYLGKELTVIAWLWARTVTSPSPAFSSARVPLISSLVLSQKEGKQSWIEICVSGDKYQFYVRSGRPPEGAELGTKLGRGAHFRCVLSGAPITPDYIKAEGIAGRLSDTLMAVVVEGERSRIYLSPSEEMLEIARTATSSWRPDSPLPDDPRNFWTPSYGLARWSDLFTARQLVALTTLSNLTHEAAARCERDAASRFAPADGGLAVGGVGAKAYGEAVGVYLGFAVDKVAECLSTLCTWSSAAKNELVVSTFRRQALPMTWDFAEANPFADSSGSFDKISAAVARVLDIALPASVHGFSEQEDAAAPSTRSDRIISTDPPYYDNIAYADLSDFFYVWLRKALKPTYPDLCATLTVPKTEELIASPYRHGSKGNAETFFLDGMTRAIHNLSAHSHPCFPTTIYYAFKQSETADDAGTASTGWDTFLQAVIEAGFGITGTWPMRTERDSRSISIGTNALASSIVLVCRVRSPDAPTVSRRDFLRHLSRALPAALTEMTADPIASIAPVDLAQAAIGPGMAIFSKYSQVLEADGTPMPVRHALAHINKAIDDFFTEAEGDFDSATRFCIGWFQQFGFEPGAFGEADVLARAKGTAVDKLEASGVVTAPRSKVRLLKVKEYAKKWSPESDLEASVWQACHQMSRALAESEHDAGLLLARMPAKEDAIRQLAYRLYTLCERTGRAEEARSYNELVTSWPAIVDESHKRVGEQTTMFGGDSG